MEDVLSIGQVARRSGVAVSALRYYEERGLIASERIAQGNRRFPRSTLRRIAFIVFAQKLGMSLDEIGAALAKLPTDHVPTGRDWSRLSRPWRARIDEQIAQLQRLKEGLATCIACGSR
jgi:MerR family transcriptional regulator, redox-sensitive transcriptional activator SoxR